jgi:hypothetical protein
VISSNRTEDGVLGFGQRLPIGLQDGVIDDAEASIQEIIREPEVCGLGLGQFLEISPGTSHTTG